MSSPSPEPVAALPLAVFSMAVLALEVLLSRVLSYSVHTLLLYAALGVALLGFGAAGSLVALRPDWLTAERLPQALAWSACATVYSVLFAFAAFTRVTPNLHSVDLLTFSTAALLMLPFLAAGTVITLALACAEQALPSTYAANLIGSGLGCFLPLGLLGSFDAAQLLALLAGLAWLAACAWVRRAAGSWRAPIVLAHGVSLLLVVVSFANARTVFPIAPEPAPLGQVTVIRAAAAAHQIRMVRHYDASSAVGRIEIFGFEQMPGRTEPYPYMFYSQDSSAGSILVRWNGRTRSQLPPGAPGGVVDRLCEESLCGGAYFRARPKVLIIGLGGAPDLVCARYHEAQHIDVVEINPRTIEAVRGPFAHFLGGAPDGPSVHFHLRDGRGFAHGTHGEGYDLVQLSGTDTKQNLATGSLTLSENHLYTVEAFRDYLRSLNDHGVLAFVRFGEPEALRLANTAVVALHELGIRTPVAQHIAIVHDGSIYELMVRRTPFPRFEARRLAQRLTSRTSRSQDSAFTDIFGQRAQKPIELGYVPYGAAQQPFSRFFEDVAVGKVAAFNAAYPYDIRPTTDDWPFFFDLFRHDDLSSWLRAPHLVILRNILVSLVLLSLLLVLIPVLGGRKALRGGGLLAVPLYFGSIGFAYLFVEVWLLSRFAMYLGHQMHGLSVVLSSLLVSSGLGSAMSARLLPRARLRALLAGVLIVLLLVLVAASMSAVTEATWSASLAARVLVSIAFIAPLGFCMGFPMPAGLAWSGAAYPNSIALCVGINGFGSVIATIAVLPLSLWFGYSGVLAIGGCLYALSSLLALGWRGGPPVDGVPVGKRPLAPAAAAK